MAGWGNYAGSGSSSELTTYFYRRLGDLDNEACALLEEMQREDGRLDLEGCCWPHLYGWEVIKQIKRRDRDLYQKGGCDVHSTSSAADKSSLPQKSQNAAVRVIDALGNEIQQAMMLRQLKSLMRAHSISGC